MCNIRKGKYGTADRIAEIQGILHYLPENKFGTLLLNVRTKQRINKLLNEIFKRETK